MKKLTQKRLKELLRYSKETGHFTWNVSKGSRAKAGMVAGTVQGAGYITIQIDKKIYLAHRLAWLYVEGYFPETLIDHKNRNKSDNRFCNLRVASKQCNARNSNTRRDNKSVVTGVCYDKSRGKWLVQMMVNGEKLNLGRYEDMLDAVKARWKSEVENNFKTCNTTSSAYEYIKKHDPDFLNKPLQSQNT